MTKIGPLLFAAIIVGFAGQGLILNTWDLLHLRLPQYFINPSLLSGTLLLYDRPMFFESRHIDIKEAGEPLVKTVDYDLHTDGFDSYLQRRLFRFATNETQCGGDCDAAFEQLFCKSPLLVLREKKIETVSVRFTPHIRSGRERVFHHLCQRDE